jgi:hypothetical protein
MWLIVWKLGLAVAAMIMVIHGIDTAAKAARDAHQLWLASRAKDDGNRDR